MAGRKREASKSREILEVAKAFDGLAIDIRRILATVNFRHLKRAGDVLRALDAASAEVRELGIDAEVGKVIFDGPDAGPDLPIMAAIEAAQARPVAELAGDGDDWRAVHLSKLFGHASPLFESCRQAGLKLAGEAWDEVTTGRMTPEFLSEAEAVAIVKSLAALRAKAGDPIAFAADAEGNPIYLPPARSPKPKPRKPRARALEGQGAQAP
jgi:hypothetical protein